MVLDSRLSAAARDYQFIACDWMFWIVSRVGRSVPGRCRFNFFFSTTRMYVRPCNLYMNAYSARATLLLILWKLMEGSLPKVLALHTPEIIDTVTGESC